MSTKIIAVPPGFDLTQAVCSYGFFILSPNKWLLKGPGGKAVFERPLHVSRSQYATVKVTQHDSAAIKISADHALTSTSWTAVTHQVARMLRLSAKDCEDIAGFQALSQTAAQQNFGRLFRSPDVWEDMVKSILLCNCGWGRTVAMNAALVKHVGKGAFPTASQTAEYGAEQLQADCGLGYRARTLCKLAQQVAAGDIQLEAFEAGSSSATSWEEVEPEIRKAAGMGPFTAANVLQLMGYYGHVPCDSETMRHLKKHHGVTSCPPGQLQQRVQQVYAKYAPFQFLAYWHELWRDYEAQFGSFASMDPRDYVLLTGHNMRQQGHTQSQPEKPRKRRKTQPTAAAAAAAPAAGMDCVQLGGLRNKANSCMRAASQVAMKAELQKQEQILSGRFGCENRIR
ncbi:hypothetical protein WJX84_010076 [Apatococcus fuscideae]|uniref:HhH-GPD domain-containing protein n=1 Tax=Apatococcus fuscideae TaxID=2026836 RepID=A0AAW1SP84_9CHLO